jgi:hypothetical protein
MKQTAVEWLQEALMTSENAPNYNQWAFNKAKEMEKEQHGNTWDTALDKYEVRAGNYMRAYEDFDDYYNENYKSE